MFSYLRYFSIISAVVITIAAVALGYYFRSSAGADLSDLVIKNNRVLVQGFINNVWKNHEMVQMLGLFRKHSITPDNWHRYRGYKENYEAFSRDVFKYFEEMPVVHVNIYDSNGEKLLSLNQSKILEKSSIAIQLEEPGSAISTVQRALSGLTASNILQNANFQMADGSRKEGTIVQTAVPILADSYVPLVAGAQGDRQSNIEGMVEIYYDVTRQWEQLYQFQYVGTGAIIVIFLLLIGTLVVVAAKAEGIIARQHETNLELAAQAAAAETENENKSQFLASISHELRTPLNAIIGFSEIIRNETMGPLGNEQYKDYIRDIHNSGVHLLSLINDILDYSKAEAGKLELLIEEVDITKLIHASMRLVSPRAEHAGVQLITQVPKEHYVLHTDGKKVKQVLLNLLSNAVKFTPEGGRITVTLWQDVMENSISVEVKDSGIGIAPKDISKALSPFGQVDSALSRKYEGTGLGLPLTKKFVELMGGSFEIESEEHKGTAIRFSLPINTPLPPMQTEEEEAAATDETANTPADSPAAETAENTTQEPAEPFASIPPEELSVQPAETEREPFSLPPAPTQLSDEDEAIISDLPTADEPEKPLLNEAAQEETSETTSDVTAQDSTPPVNEVESEIEAFAEPPATAETLSEPPLDVAEPSPPSAEANYSTDPAPEPIQPEPSGTTEALEVPETLLAATGVLDTPTAEEKAAATAPELPAETPAETKSGFGEGAFELDRETPKASES